MTQAAPPGAFVLATSSITDALFDSLRTRIVTGEFQPGERLTEARISAEYGVARPTAKGCLERLVAAGLLLRSAHKTATVPAPGKGDIVDIFVAREALERRAIALLAAAHSAPGEAIRAQEALARVGEGGAFHDRVSADVRFHRSLVADAGSPRLARMHETIMGEVELTMGQYSAHGGTAVETIVGEHAAILDAVAGGDATAAEEALAAHLAHARDRLLGRLDETEG